MLDALGYAHENNIVHRDVKPENVALSEGGAILLDFGIAKLLPESGLGADNAATQTGAVLGTPLYMSPEQIRGAPITPATDIYAAGARKRGRVDEADKYRLKRELWRRGGVARGSTAG